MQHFLPTFQDIMIQLTWHWEIKSLAAVAVGFFSFFFGLDLAGPATALLVLMVIDTVLGVLAAKYMGQELTPHRFFKAPKKMLMYMVLISAAHMFERIVPGVGFFDVAMITYLAANEFLSIGRHAGRLGYPVPRKLLNMVEEYRDNVGVK